MSTVKNFNELGLASALLPALAELGYETPTPIQEQSIPVLIENKDLLAQAQTGTGKTAAFALPILSHLETKLKEPQALVIAPTRELAIQVAEAFQSYAKNLKGFHVIPIYGGQDYKIQLKALKRGAHVIVGTPGRVMDHLRRGTLTIENVKTVVLDEADEMLKMGFIDDIEWILSQIPHAHQTALFSATMPTSIQKIAKRYLKDAKKIHIKPKKSTVDSIEQFYTRVSKNQKLDLLTRFLEVEDIQATIIFARTKNASAELAEKLRARGYAAAALHGDMNQSMRERVINRIKKGTLDMIVATDVAARGIDVERISHVINFDIPYDTESYIHRIGRTGRAGRKGKALLFITPREHRILKDLEKTIGRPIKQLDPPSLKEMNERRNQQLAEKVTAIISKSKKLEPYLEIVDQIATENDSDPKDIAAALAYLIQQSNPLPSDELDTAEPEYDRKKQRNRSRRSNRRSSGSSQDKRRKSSRSAKPSSGKPAKKTSGKRKPAKPKPSKNRSKRK